MATISITIPDAVVSDVLDAFANTFGWTVDLGLTKAQFAKQITAKYIKSVYISYTAELAATIAREAQYTGLGPIQIT